MFLLILVTASYSTPPNKSTISQISMATGLCPGQCPLSALQMDSSLSFTYYGGMYSSKKGYYQGKISKVLWDEFTFKLEQANYRHLDTLYSHTFDDQPFEIIITYNDSCKHIMAQASSLPKNLKDLFHQIANSYQKVKLSPSADTIKFPTRLQYIPKVYRPKFPPKS